jgi:hypothetical protein
MKVFSDNDRLYLDDLQSGSALRAEPTSSMRSRSKHLPVNSILSPSTLITRRRRTPCYRAWRQAVGTRLRSPCASWSRVACRSLAVSSGLAVNLNGQIQPGPVTVCRLKAKSRTSGPRDPGQIEGSPLCEA